MPETESSRTRSSAAFEMAGVQTVVELLSLIFTRRMSACPVPHAAPIRKPPNETRYAQRKVDPWISVEYEAVPFHRKIEYPTSPLPTVMHNQPSRNALMGAV